MAISAYVGIPGSGKSYEVVVSVIIPACLAGRRIVTNIYGISPEKIYDYCVARKKADRDSLGDISLVTNEQVKEPLFFPYKTESGISEDSLCQPGDLICIDESWRIWENDKDIHANHRSFIAEHRHFASEESGITCDMVVMNQSVANLPRFIKDRIETTYRMSKLVSLGLTSRYRVDVFTGIKLFKNNLTTNYQCKYDKAIFPLYKSYENGQGKETVVDKRQNALNSRKLWFMVSGLIILTIASVSYLVWFFAHDKRPVPAAVPDNPVSFTPPLAAATPPKADVSTTWRISGRLRRDGQSWVILSNVDGRVRVEPSSLFSFDGLMMTGDIDGQKVTVYSGSLK